MRMLGNNLTLGLTSHVHKSGFYVTIKIFRRVNIILKQVAECQTKEKIQKIAKIINKILILAIQK